ncbi:MAG: glycosyltransferase [Euryarchaeota archaeon]|nr:glycosyltransferase [Euryarchaeota archaeon]
MRSLEDYRGIVSDNIIYDIHKKARELYGKHIVHINSTYQGGGVAEMISSVVPLMNDIGISTGWRILHGNSDFFTITKKFHNAMQGESIHFTQMKKDLYQKASEDFHIYNRLDHDCVIIHDPQPLPLIKYYTKHQPWVWRCHVDLSNPNPDVWEFIKKFLLKYDQMVVSNKKYLREGLPVDQRIIPPAIDPLTPKNMDLPEIIQEKYLEKYNIPTDKPLITQISRFDKWKDPEGVLAVFEKVRKERDCRLVLCGNMAADDPEGQEIFKRVQKKARELTKNSDVILITSENNILVNALQRKSDVILQKSLREGFGLTITEALWKGRPVVASDVGGIPSQITNRENGFLVQPEDIKGCADRVIQLLDDRKLAENIGNRGKEVVRENFLVTRLLSDHLDLLQDMLVCK